jgi:hypothetical protein
MDSIWVPTTVHPIAIDTRAEAIPEGILRTVTPTEIVIILTETWTKIVISVTATQIGVIKVTETAVNSPITDRTTLPLLPTRTISVRTKTQRTTLLRAILKFVMVAVKHTLHHASWALKEPTILTGMPIPLSLGRTRSTARCGKRQARTTFRGGNLRKIPTGRTPR